MLRAALGGLVGAGFLHACTHMCGVHICVSVCASTCWHTLLLLWYRVACACLLVQNWMWVLLNRWLLRGACQLSPVGHFNCSNSLKHKLFSMSWLSLCL